MTTFSSNISRFNQAIETSLVFGRKIVLVGRSIYRNINLARKLKYLNFTDEVFLPKNLVPKHPPSVLSLLVAGSQAQPGSALDRIVAGKDPYVKICPKDKVVFSSDYIPGNEIFIYRLIDNLYRQGAEVVYSNIHSKLHVSGHGSAKDLEKLITLLKPYYVLPIGGDFRHLIAYKRIAQKLGYPEKRIIIPDNGEVVEFTSSQKLKIKQKIKIKLPKIIQR
jgi:ribonuclease J